MSNMDNSIGNLFNSIKPKIIEKVKEEQKDGEKVNFFEDADMIKFAKEISTDILSLSTAAGLSDEPTDEDIAKFSSYFLAKLEDEVSADYGIFSGLINDNSVINKEVSTKSYESIYGGKVLSEEAQIEHLAQIGVNFSNDGYSQKSTTDANGNKQIFFEKVSENGDKEFLKVLQSETGEIQVVQTILPAGSSEGKTSVFDFDYLKNMPTTITKNKQDVVMNELYTSLLSTSDANVRKNITDRIENNILSFGYTEEQAGIVYDNVVQAYNFLQGSVKDAYTNMISTAKTLDERVQLLDMAQLTDYQIDTETFKYMLKSTKCSSTLPENQKNSFFSAYENLLNVNSLSEMDAVIDKIVNLQQVCNLSDVQLAESNNLFSTFILGGASNILKNLYEQLSKTTDYAEREKIEAEIAKVDAYAQKRYVEFDVDDKGLTTGLDSGQYSALKDLYIQLSNASNEKERQSIIIQIKNKQNTLSLSDEALQHSAMNITSAYNASVAAEVAGDLDKKASNSDYSEDVQIQLDVNNKKQIGDAFLIDFAKENGIEIIE